jgi:hypothetical protein
LIPEIMGQLRNIKIRNTTPRTGHSFLDIFTECLKEESRETFFMSVGFYGFTFYVFTSELISVGS